MKPDEQIRNYRSNVEGDAVKMSIDADATAHIMDVLTKLYADPELAIIREYSTNALDSHIEAGVTRPIEVTLPTSLAPFLTIRDYGIGLDADGIRDIYSRYGTSTKRGSNEAVGMLGLGCKSALSYTDQFTLTGFKDGTRTEVLISRDEDGAGSMTIVDEGPCDPAGNGVKVTIPVKGQNAVEHKARNFFKFWTPGTVLLNGKQPPRIGDDPEQDHIWLDENTLLTTAVKESLVVMGNVPYPLTDGEDSLFQRAPGSMTYGSWWHAVCFVDIGAVSFAPSRESLMSNRRTKAKLAELRQTILELRDTAIRRQVADAATAKEAQELLRKGQQLGFNRDDATWNGRRVVLRLKRARPGSSTDEYMGNPDEWVVDEAVKYSYLLATPTGYMKKNGERSLVLDLSNEQRIFSGFDGKYLTNVKRAKLELWAKNESIRLQGKLVFVEKLSADEKFWLSGWDIHNWADVEAVELPKTVMPNGSTVRLRGSYDIILDGQLVSGVPADKIAGYAQARPILWMHANARIIPHSAEVQAGIVDTSLIVALSGNRIEKFKRDFPQAKNIRDAAVEAAERWRTTVTDEMLVAVQTEQVLHNYPTQYLDMNMIDDPAIRRALRYLKIDTSGYYEARKKYGRWLVGGTVVDTTHTKAKAAAHAFAKYPLLALFSNYSQPDKNHLHLYLNAAYAAEKGA